MKKYRAQIRVNESGIIPLDEYWCCDRSGCSDAAWYNFDDIVPSSAESKGAWYKVEVEVEEDD